VEQVIKQRRFARRLQADDRDDEQFPILNAQIMKKKDKQKWAHRRK